MTAINHEKLRRSRIFYSLLLITLTGLIVLLIYSLQSLIVPFLIGTLSAYICLPLLNYLIRKRIPRGISFILLFGVFIIILFFGARQIMEMVPDEKEILELRVRLQYKTNELYLRYMGMEDFDSKGNFFYEMIGEDLQPLIVSINNFLLLNNEEQELFRKYAEGFNGQKKIAPKLVEYFNVNKNLPFLQDIKIEKKSFLKTNENKKGEKSGISILLDEISIWMITPFVFLFMLFDDGEIKRFMINLIPNRYFEMSLTTLDNIDNAVGSYLRGTLLESLLVGITFFLALLLLGFDFQSSIIIGAIAGITNAIPLLGPVIGAVFGIIYALIVEDISPLIPFMNSENVIIGVIAAVFIVQMIDNAIFAPLVLGKSVNLHPIIVIIAITGGSIIFGFAGMLFAIPAVVILNVFITTIYRELKDYNLIY